MSASVELGNYTYSMSATQNEVYVVQDLPDRYIKMRVLEEYINARIHEFGVSWQLSVRSVLRLCCCLA
jgi:hypothetical protein